MQTAMQVPDLVAAAATTPEELKSPGDLNSFIDQVITSFNTGLDYNDLVGQADLLAQSLKRNLQDASSLSMLPSFINFSPTGLEYGTVLAIDIGGSTMRVALVLLDPGATNEQDRLRIRAKQQWLIDDHVRELEGQAFFSWIAANVQSFLVTIPELGGENGNRVGSIRAGLVWSFPLAQTELNDGLLQDMGKGFKVGVDLKGQSLNKCLSAAFDKLNSPIRVEAILNDSISVLLAMAYLDPTTQISVIAGTGCNGALKLPVSSLSPAKFQNRTPSWTSPTGQVLVDAELCVTGMGILPRTRWDKQLADMIPGSHVLGLELLAGGRFLGEICRQVILEAIEKYGLFSGLVPDRIKEPFSWGLEHMAPLSITNPSYSIEAQRHLSTMLKLGTPLEDNELSSIGRICNAIVKRAAIFIAVAIHSMCILQSSPSVNLENTNRWHTTRKHDVDPIANNLQAVSCLGSVIEKYPGFISECQQVLDSFHQNLDAKSIQSQTRLPRLKLKVAPDSSLTGVAVAALMDHKMTSSKDLNVSVLKLPDTPSLDAGSSYSNLPAIAGRRQEKVSERNPQKADDSNLGTTRDDSEKTFVAYQQQTTASSLRHGQKGNRSRWKELVAGCFGFCRRRA